MVQEVEEHLAIGETLYWESGVGLEKSPPEGTPRRSRRGTWLYVTSLYAAFVGLSTLDIARNGSLLEDSARGSVYGFTGIVSDMNVLSLLEELISKEGDLVRVFR